jgi:hypothetical protein
MAEKDLHNEASIRFLLAVNTTHDVDVVLNKKQIVAKLSFQKVSNYILLQPGAYTIEMVYSHNHNEKILSTTIIIESGQFYTMTVMKEEKKSKLFMIQNSPSVPVGEAKIRFLHLACNMPVLDLAVKDRDVVFPNISFQEATDYLGLTPMTVDLELRIAGSKQVVLPMPKLQFKANAAYTIVLASTSEEIFLLKLID